MVAQAQTLPPGRRVDWSVTGKKDIFPNTRDTLNIMNFGGNKDSAADNKTAIEQAMQALANREGVIYFPPGKYLFKGSVTMRPGVTIQGSGTMLTFFYFAASAGTSSDAFVIGSYNYPAAFSDVIAGYNKESKQLKLQSPNDFVGASYVELLEDNGAWDTVPADWATNTVGQIIPIDSIKQDTLHLRHAIRIDYQASLNPRIRPLQPIKHVAFKCFTIQRADNPAQDVSFFSFFNAVECSISGVNSIKSKAAHVKIDRSSNITISGCYFTDAFLFDGTATRGYGIVLFTRTGECLIENNVFKKLRHAISIKQGANGNVISYNYVREGLRSEIVSDFTADINLHGHYAYANLIEGNIADNIFTDQTYGPAGPDNTFLRNRSEGYGMGVFNTGTQVTSSQNYIDNDVPSNKPIPFFITYFSTPMALNGTNHLSVANRVAGVITPAGSTTVNEISYYLTAKPSFWTSTNDWPSIGLPSIYNSGSIPARDRYLAGQVSTCQLFIQTPIILPIQILQFKTTLINNNVVVDWLIDGTEFSKLQVERSINNRDFEPVTTSMSAKSVFFDKPASTQSLYYRLKVYNKASGFVYSSIQFIGERKHSIIAPPYFSKEGLVVSVQIEPGTKQYVKIFSVQGQLFQQQELIESKTYITTDKCTAGLWLICICNDAGTVGTFKVVKL